MRPDGDVRCDHADGPVAGNRGLQDDGLFDVRRVEWAIRQGLPLRKRREMVAAVHRPVRGRDLQVQVVHEGFRGTDCSRVVVPREDELHESGGRDVERVRRIVSGQEARGPVDDLRAERVSRGGDREDLRQKDPPESLLVIRPRIRRGATDGPGSGDLLPRGDEERAYEGGARRHRVRRDRRAGRIPSVGEVLADNRGGGGRRGRCVTRPVPLHVCGAAPAHRISVRHRGVAVENRYDGRLDAAIDRRPAAALWCEVVLGDDPSRSIRIIRAPDRNNVLRCRRRADRRRIAPRVSGGEQDRHVGMGPHERVNHSRRNVVHVRVGAPAVAVDPDRCDRIVVHQARRAEEVRVVLRKVDQVLAPEGGADPDALGEPADVLQVDLREERVPVVRRSTDPVVVPREG